MTVNQPSIRDQASVTLNEWPFSSNPHANPTNGQFEVAHWAFYGLNIIPDIAEATHSDS